MQLRRRLLAHAPGALALQGSLHVGALRAGRCQLALQLTDALVGGRQLLPHVLCLPELRGGRGRGAGQVGGGWVNVPTCGQDLQLRDMLTCLRHTTIFVPAAN